MGKKKEKSEFDKLVEEAQEVFKKIRKLLEPLKEEKK